MSSRNNTGGANPSGPNGPVEFDETLEEIVQNEAVDVAEKNSDLSESARIIELISQEVRSRFERIDEDIVGAMANEVYDRALKIKELEKKEKGLEQRRQFLENKFTVLADSQEVKDNFAILIPVPKVNPNVAKDILEGNFRQAAMGAGHKIARSYHLKSAAAYNLKTKEEKATKGKSADQTPQMAEYIGESQHEVKFNEKIRRPRLLKEINEINERLDNLLKVKPAAKEKVKQLKAILKEVSNHTEDIEDAMEDYDKMLQLMQVEEDQARGGSVDRAAGRLYSGYRKLIWANKNHPLYEKTFNDQALVERKLVNFESQLKAELGEDYSANPIEENVNARSIYVPETTVMLDFEDRQKRLIRRLELVKNLLTATANEYEGMVKENDKNIEAEKMDKVGNEGRVRAIDKNEKKWGKVETPNLEKLFWHEFGQRVGKIREWQAKLPTCGRRGPAAFRNMTTNIFYHYEQLRKDVALLERNGGFTGLMTILDRELGRGKSNPFNWKAEEEKLALELVEIRKELARRKKKTSIPGLNAPPEPSEPTPPAPPVAPASATPTPPTAPPVAPSPVSPPLTSSRASTTNVGGGTVRPTYSGINAGFGGVDVGRVGPWVGVVGITPAFNKVTPGKTGVAVKVEEPESKEVQRPYELVAIGDLHGNLDIFEASLKSLGLIEANANVRDLANLKWAGGNRKLILLGDKIAERKAEGLPIEAAIRALKPQAEAAGGKIVEIDGNHEDFLKSWLSGKKTAGLTKNDQLESIANEYDEFEPITQCIGGERANSQGLGVMEFVDKYSDYISKTGKKFNSLEEAATNLYQDYKNGSVRNLGKEVLENMRESAEGKETLEQFCQMKLLELDGDTIFIHTELTQEILEQLEGNESIEEIVDSINRLYQQGLRKLLLDEGEMPENFDFYKLKNIFLDTNNRTGGKPVEKQISRHPEKFEALRKKGVKRFVHGHTDISFTGIRKEIGGVEIINIDASAGKEGEKMNERSIFALYKDGEMKTGRAVQLKPLIVEKAEQKLSEKEEEIEKMNIVKDWLVDIFPISDEKNLPESEVSLLIGAFDSLNSNALKEKLENRILKAVLQYFSTGSLFSVKQMPERQRMKMEAAYIYQMITFHDEWLKPEITKGKQLEDLLNEIQGFNIPLFAMPHKWRDLHGTKQDANIGSPANQGSPNTQNESSNVITATSSEDKNKAASLEGFETLRNLPITGKFDFSKSPTPDEKLLKSDDVDALFKEVYGKLPYLFGEMRDEENKKLLEQLNQLKESADRKLLKLLKILYGYQREIRFLFTGELGGIRVLALKQAGNNVQQPKVLPLLKGSNLKGLEHIMNVSGKLLVLKGKFSELDGKDVSELKKSFNGEKGILEWLNKLS